MAYTTRMGRDFLKKKKSTPNIPQLWWNDMLPAEFTFGWKANWAAERASKEAGLIWQLWHHALAVNEWWVKINPQAEPECLNYDKGESESIVHCFWSYSQATVA
jgi:hypothetical protein